MSATDPTSDPAAAASQAKEELDSRGQGRAKARRRKSAADASRDPFSRAEPRIVEVELDISDSEFNEVLLRGRSQELNALIANEPALCEAVEYVHLQAEPDATPSGDVEEPIVVAPAPQKAS